ncbi:hypothetical protein C4585_00010 [Candidatus Parcubacteria bacterium]|nr:MAG: hypothetical protein C4585_00010 [Candidatus Parcubacteria bacterium]
MRDKIFKSLLISLEWRIIAYVITNLFLWVTTGEFWKAAGLALVLQVILFFAFLIWHLFRVELRVSLKTHPIRKIKLWW